MDPSPELVTISRSFYYDLLKDNNLPTKGKDPVDYIPEENQVSISIDYYIELLKGGERMDEPSDIAGSLIISKDRYAELLQYESEALSGGKKKHPILKEGDDSRDSMGVKLKTPEIVDQLPTFKG